MKPPCDSGERIVVFVGLVIEMLYQRMEARFKAYDKPSRYWMTPQWAAPR
jgi:hypothetical protein